MKKIFITLTLISLVALPVFLGSSKVIMFPEGEYIKPPMIKPPIIIPMNSDVVITEPAYDYTAFLYALGDYESNNNYSRVNTLGYMGRFQFGKSTLKTIKIKTSRRNFLNNQSLQDSAMLLNLKFNKKRLQKYIDLYDGKLYRGRLVTESGILAAAHLSGKGNVKRFFKRGRNPKDSYGTRLTTYLYKFSGYELKLEEK